MVWRDGLGVKNAHCLSGAMLCLSWTLTTALAEDFNAVPSTHMVTHTL